MNNQKDELVTGAELARRLKMNRSFITNNKAKLKSAKCTYGNKYYFEKSSKLLGKNPNNPHESNQSQSQKTETIKSDEKSTTVKDEDDTEKTEKQDAHKSDNTSDSEDMSDLLQEIEETLRDKGTVYDKALLDGLKAKASITKTYYEAENEKIKNRKLEDNLFERDDVVKILSFAMNVVRNSLINLPNNYAVSLDGLNQKEVKDYVTEDINKILEDLQNVDAQFE